MPSVTHTRQSFSIDGRRHWMLAALIEYARLSPDWWRDRIRSAEQAGFNTVTTIAPWFLHEPRRGKFTFEGDLALKAFIRLCGDAGLKVVLRAGPFVGAGYDGGGIPGWLVAEQGMRVREGKDLFLDRVNRYFHKLFGEIEDLQASSGGPVVAVQLEHTWNCGHDQEAERYLEELVRLSRECGITLPLLNTNNLWVDRGGTIDTWFGTEDLLTNLRQLRTIQTDAPCIASGIVPAVLQSCGEPPVALPGADEVIRRIAEVLATGSHALVAPFHTGVNFGFSGGRLPGAANALTTTMPTGALVDECGHRTQTYHRLRPLTCFAGAFAPVFAELDPDYQPVISAPQTSAPASRTAKNSSPSLSIVPLRGGAGQIIFAFSSALGGETDLILSNGWRLPIDLGEEPVGWYVQDIDLGGRGRLDFANVSPLALVDRSILILHGPPKHTVLLSINDAPLQATIPVGGKPTIIDHKGMRLLLVTTQAARDTYFDATTVHVGACGLDAAGHPLLAEGWPQGFSVSRDGEMTTYGPAKPARRAAGAPARSETTKSIKFDGWSHSSAEAWTTGESARFAGLAQPVSLAECGAPTGYGWYRLRFDAARAGERAIHLPRAFGRLHLYIDGEPRGILGGGSGGRFGPTECKLTKGSHQLVVFADNAGRFSDGNDLGRVPGLTGGAYEVRALTAKSALVNAIPFDPFAARRFIWGVAPGQFVQPQQIEWIVSHKATAPLIVDLRGRAAGTVMLNGKPVAFFAGATGAGHDCLVFEPGATPGFEGAKHSIRFAPAAAGADLKELISQCRFFAAAGIEGEWAYAKWEPPQPNRFAAMSAADLSRGAARPGWWKTAFEVTGSRGPLLIDLNGLTKGQVLVNDRNLGRYFVATAAGKAVGPSTKLVLPGDWLRESAPNDLLIFDEHGGSPAKVRVTRMAP